MYLLVWVKMKYLFQVQNGILLEGIQLQGVGQWANGQAEGSYSHHCHQWDVGTDPSVLV